MKNPMMLVCAMVAAMGLSTMAADEAAAVAGNNAAQVKAEKGKKAAGVNEERINKFLEEIKAKDEALYKELVALREKDPVAFKAKIRELRQQQAGKNGGEKGGERKHKKGNK